MKFKITSIAIFLLFLATIPVFIIKFDYLNNDVSKSKISENKENIYEYVASLYKEGYTDETIKAITIICQSNYIFDSQNFITNINSTHKNKANIERIANSVDGYYLAYNNKSVYIPFFESSNGTTIKDDKYSYLSSVASPWDTYNRNYDKTFKCVGVSLDGLNYLCKNGATAEEALKWYLPDFEIIKDNN